MKKFFVLSFMLSAVLSTTLHAQSGPQAQGNPDPAAMLNLMKEKQVPGLVEKAGLTTAEANKLVEINFELRQKMMTDMQGLSEADRSKRIAEFKAAKEKKYSEIPLTAEQIKAVYSFYEDMGKNSQRKSGN